MDTSLPSIFSKGRCLGLGKKVISDIVAGGEGKNLVKETALVTNVSPEVVSTCSVCSLSRSVPSWQL